jgi:hypothetical protein
MKKLTLLLGAAFIMGTAAFAGDGHKDAGCCKGKKETASCSKDKKEVASKEHGCCKKGESKTAANDVKKAPAKETKTTVAKKS